MSSMSESRAVALETPLGADVLLFYRMRAHEELGRLPRFELEVLSDDEDIDLGGLLGEAIKVSLATRDDGTRYFNGHVTRFEYAGRSGRRALYRLEVHPWLWFLHKRSNCRIFHDMSVLDILKAVCGDHGYSAIKDDRLARKPDKREYTVQYRESDFDFVSRLLEDEGIYYWFEHADGSHEMVLGDGSSSHEAAPGYETVSIYGDAEKAAQDRDHIARWSVAKRVVSKGFVLDDWNFETPTVDLVVEKEEGQDGSPDAAQEFDYPGGFFDTGVGDGRTQRRLEEAQSEFEVGQGAGNARGLMTGFTFELEGATRTDQRRAYLIRSITHEITGDSYESGGSGGGGVYQNRFVAVDAQAQLRPARTTPRPAVRGPQTAKVVGSGDIDVDEYGRVLLTFHWDREATESIRVRVSHNWAGANWGGIFMPHVGHEVIVDFLEGNPDRPIVVGRVYNAENMPPNPLPDDKTKAILRDMAGNEFIMESKSGSEMIELRDKYGNEMVMDAVAGTIKLYSPSHNSELALGRSIQLFTDSNMDTDVKGNQGTVVAGNQQAKVGGSRIEEIVGKHDVKVGADMLQVYGGMKHDTTVGSVSGFTGGAKTEIFVGVETKKAKARSYEDVTGKKFVKSAAEEVKKCPTLKEDYDNVKQFYKDKKTKVTDALTEAKGKWETKCADWKAKADKVKEDFSARKTKISGELSETLGSLKEKVSGTVKRQSAMLEEKANMIKKKASSIFLG